MIASARNAYILKRLEEAGVIDYKNISRELQVSEATVRRDFEKLEKNGQLRRVQGGAVRKEEMVFGELSVVAKNTIHVAQKQQVARAAAAEVQDGDSIFLDCGTSMAPLAELFLSKRIRIVTNNNLILPMARQMMAAEIYTVGGRFCPADQMFVGPLAEEILSSFTFQRVFIGCTGWDPVKKDVYVTDLECLAIKRIAMRNSQRQVLLIDSTKAHKQGPYRLAGCEDFSCVYVDDDGTEHSYPDNFVIAGS